MKKVKNQKIGILTPLSGTQRNLKQLFLMSKIIASVHCACTSKDKLVWYVSALKKKFRTHVIKSDIAPKSYPPGQYLLVSASNNMLYYLSQ
jgi:hypothetical protein